MTRESAQTISDLKRTTEPLKLPDVVRVTGRSRQVIMAEIDRGRLRAFRVIPHRGSPWLFAPDDVLEWWNQLTHTVPRGVAPKSA